MFFPFFRKAVVMKISQAMIVKNEEKNIERALSWGKGIVSEQIVIDTGRTGRWKSQKAWERRLSPFPGRMIFRWRETLP